MIENRLSRSDEPLRHALWRACPALDGQSRVRCASGMRAARLSPACSERIDSKAAVHHGSLVELVAAVIATGRTSMTVS